MWILPFVGYAGLILGFAFLVLAIASGLYYLSELVEEHTVIAKKSIERLIYAIILVQALLWLIDGYPAIPSLLSIGSHALYHQNLRRFPIVKLSDPIFIASCVLVLVNHYLWFRHFSQPPTYSAPSSSHPYRRFAGESPYEPYPSFTEIASFFGLCVWLVPFALFVSLSASENVLPSMGSEYATGEGSSYISAGKEPSTSGGLNSARSSRQGMAKAAVDSIRGWIGETGEMLGYTGGRRARHDF